MPDKGKEQEEGTVRVVDRRRFTSGGERRPDVELPPETPPPPRPEATPPSGSAKSATAPPPGESERARSARQAYDQHRGPRNFKVDFESLVMSLSTSAMLHLGLIEDPARAGLPADLEAARHTIDMLGVIQEKTRGNLTPREAQLLEQVVYELRLAFVHVSTGKKPGAPPGA